IALRAAEEWSPAVLAPRRLARVADVAAARAAEPDHRAPALQTLAWSASTPEHFAVLDHAAADDVDLAWRVLVRRASLGRYDEAWLERAQDLADGDQLAPAIRNVLLLVIDQLTRVMDART